MGSRYDIMCKKEIKKLKINKNSIKYNITSL